MCESILFLRGQYISSLKILKTLLENNIQNRRFQDEILPYYRDGILDNWLRRQGAKRVEVDSSAARKDILNSIYKSIVGDICPFDLSSKFSEVWKIERVLVDGSPVKKLARKIYVVTANTIEIEIVSSVRVDDDFVLSIRPKKGEPFSRKRIKSCVSNQKKCYTFDVSNLNDASEDVFSLVEGDENVLFDFHLVPKLLPLFDIDSELKAFYVDSNVLSALEISDSFTYNRYSCDQAIGLLKEINKKCSPLVFRFPQESEFDSIIYQKKRVQRFWTVQDIQKNTGGQWPLVLLTQK